jgi:hypothetical protein
MVQGTRLEGKSLIMEASKKVGISDLRLFQKARPVKLLKKVL